MKLRMLLAYLGIWKSITMNIYSNKKVTLGKAGSTLPESERVSLRGLWIAIFPE